MSRMFGVQFRGAEHEVEITHDGGYEHDTGAHSVEWQFVEDGIGKDITAEEENAVLDQIYAVINDPHWRDDEPDWRDYAN